jgi:hypothetical protein
MPSMHEPLATITPYLTIAPFILDSANNVSIIIENYFEQCSSGNIN